MAPSNVSPSNSPMWTILLVEDEYCVRQVTRHVLEQSGYLVLEAAGPQEALAVLRHFEGPINLLLTDVVMPHMSGAQLAARLKQMRPGLATLFMSGYAKSAAVTAADLANNAGYLQKPFSTSTLLARVSEALSLPPGTRDRAGEIRLPI